MEQFPSTSGTAVEINFAPIAPDMSQEPSPQSEVPPQQPGAAAPPPAGYPPMPQGYPQGYGYGGQGGYPYPPPHPGQVSYPPGYMPPPPGYPAMPQGYPQPYPGQPYPGQPYPGQPMMPPGYPQQPYPGQPMMPPGYAMPPHPGMASGPLPAPVAAPPVPTAEAVPAAVPAPVAIPAAPLPAPVAAAVPAPVVAPAPMAAAVEAAHADEAGLPQLFHPEAAHDFGPPPKRHPLIEFWRKAGGGSLTLSIAIHVGLLLLAGLVVFTSTQTIKNVDFLPGGGTAQGAQASQDLQHKVQQKRRSTIAKTTPMKKVVSNNSSSSIQLPDAPADILDVPDVSSMLGGGSLGGGGFGKGGGGGGFGNGMGMGAAGGFVSLPPTMRARCSTTERLEKLRQNGGSSECEAAVSRALEWLKTKQNTDGSWGSRQ